MLLVKGDQITFKYNTQMHNLFTDINFRIDGGSRIGIVGKNGSGKSTLLKIILGELRPSAGHVQIFSGLKIGYLKQVQPEQEFTSVADFIWSSSPGLFKIKKRLLAIEHNTHIQDWSAYSEYEEAGGYEFEISVEKNLKIVGLNPLCLPRPLRELSGGEKTKVGLLRNLVTNPNLLILDEPTNNLDLKSILWLKEFLKSTKLPYVLVSHDRLLLNECAKEVWELDRENLRVFSGNYNFFQHSKTQERQSKLEQFEQQQKRIVQLQRAAQKRRVDANSMENFKESRSIKKNGGLCKRDEGSGSGKANPTKKMKAAKAVEKRIELVIEREEAKKPWIEKKREIKLPVSTPCLSKVVLFVKELGMKYGDSLVFSNIGFSVERGQKFAIVGANGSGKSSLVKILSYKLNQYAGEFKWSPSATVRVFYQDNIDLENDETVLNSVWYPDVMEEHTVRTVLGSLGLEASIINQRIKTLSSGEKVKVSLAKTVLSRANTLVLDEPTNHLEIQGREMLEQALIEYEGTVIVVSHDMAFIEKINARVYDLNLNRIFDSLKEWRATMK